MEPCDPRTYLAAERTLLAWIRTGLALMGFGFIAARFSLFLHEEAVPWATRPLPPDISLPAGIALIVMGDVVIVCAAVRHQRFLRALDRGEFRSAFGSTFPFFITGALGLVGLGLTLYLALI